MKRYGAFTAVLLALAVSGTSIVYAQQNTVDSGSPETPEDEAAENGTLGAGPGPATGSGTWNGGPPGWGMMGPGMMAGPGMHADEGDGWGPGMGHADAWMEDGNPRMFGLWEYLALSEDQKTRLTSLELNYIRTASQAQASLRIARAELAVMLDRDSPDMTAVERKIREAERFRGDLEVARVQFRVQAYAILTPAQKRQLETWNRGQNSVWNGTGASGAGAQGRMFGPGPGSMWNRQIPPESSEPQR